MFSFAVHYPIPHLLYVFFYLLCTSCVFIRRSLSHTVPLVCILLFDVYQLCSHLPFIIPYRTSCMYSFICCVPAVFSFAVHYPIPHLLYVFFYLLCTSCVLICRSLSHTAPLVCILLFVVYQLCSHLPFIIPYRASCMYSFICCVPAVFSFTVHYPIPHLLYVFFYLLCTTVPAVFSFAVHYPIPCLLYVFFYLLFTSHVLIRRSLSHTAPLVCILLFVVYQ